NARSADPAAAGYADLAEVGTAGVAATSTGLVVVERAVHDRGHCDIVQAPTPAGADKAGAAGAAGGIGAAEGLVVRERTPATAQGRPVGIKARALARPPAVEEGVAPVAAAAAVAADGPVARERTVLDGERRAVVGDAAAGGEADGSPSRADDAAIAGDGLV